MTFWVIAAILTALVTVALLAPLARAGGRDRRDDDAHDAEVYSDQLAELDRDIRNGLISETEAGYARAEIARRLLRSAGNEGGDAAQPKRPSRLLAVARVLIIAGVPTAALSAYLVTGNPGLPHQPLASRQDAPAAASDIATLISQAEQHLAANPEDGRGWDVLGPIYLRTGRFEDARIAFNNAIRLLGPSGPRQIGLGETLVALAGGVVTEEARLAFQLGRELEPDDPRPKFFLALADAQEGRTDRARTAFQRLAALSPADAPWLPAVEAQLAALDAASGATTDAATRSGPDEADIAAAQAMAPADRRAMIEGMVASLDQRLRADPDDIDGWLQLVRSYGVLGRTDEANDALRRGLEAFPPDSEEGRLLAAAAEEAGLTLPEGDGAQ